MRRSIIRTIGVFILSLATTTTGFAQLDKEVEVTREFKPTVEQATKLSLTPDMSDDSYITPDIDYTITPISIHSALETPIYQPIEANFWQYQREKRYYLRLALGLPYSSEADIYANIRSDNDSYIFAFLNQTGRYADIRNDYGIKNNSLQNHLRLGTAAGKYLGERSIEGAITYHNDIWSRYATTAISDKVPLYQQLKFNGHFGDTFTNWDKWNYRLDLKSDYFWSCYNDDVINLVANGEIGHAAWGGELLFNFGYDYTKSNNGYDDNMVIGGVVYGYDNNRAHIKFGLEYIHDRVSDTNNATYSNYFIPKAEFNYQLMAQKLYAYADLGGEVIRNDYASLVQRNPYIAEGEYAKKSSVDYHLNIGLKGGIDSGALKYNLYAGYNFIQHNIYWAYVEQTDLFNIVENSYIIDYSNQNNLNINLEVDYKISSSLAFDLDIKLDKIYNDDDQYIEDGEACSTINFGGKYNIGRFTFGLGGEMVSSRDFTQISINNLYNTEIISTIELPLTLELNANIDVKLDNGMIVYAVLNNICNNDIYRWARYREYGINGMLGVKIEF